MFDKCRKLVTPFEGMAAHSVQFEKEAVIELDVAEEKINSLQQLKAEILPMINSIREDLNRDALNSFYTNRACDNLDIVAAKLSAV